MTRSLTKQKRHAHDLIERMAPAQLSAVVSLLEIMLDPLASALANSSEEDESVSERDAHEAENSKAALARGEGVPHEKILSDFGLSAKEFERMGNTPLKAERRKQ